MELVGPEVSIVIPAYQVAHLIAETLASVQSQTLASWQAIIIDDGSTDALSAAVQPFLGDKRFELHHFANAGLAEARNRGIALAKAPKVAFLDGDDIYENNYLERMVARLDERPEVGFVTCDVTLFGDPSSEGYRFSELEPRSLPITLTRVLTREFTFSVTCMARTAVVRRAGGFDPSLRAAEDFDLWTRLLIEGVEADYVAEPLVRYRRRAGSLSQSPVLFRGSIAIVYLRLMIAVGGDANSSICRDAVHRQLALLDQWEGREALLDGRWREARSKLRRAALHLPGWRPKVLAVVTMLIPRVAALLLRVQR